MKPAFRRCLALWVFLAIPAAAGAAGITYDCDTAANHFSELSLPAGGAAFTVSGTVQLRALAPSKTYAPIARILIAPASAPGQSPGTYAGFALSALPTDAKKMPNGAPALQMLSYNSSGHEDEVLPLSMMTKPGTAQAFTLTYDGSKLVVNLAGAEARSFPLVAGDPVVRIVCSTGEFLFTDLTIAPSR
jgi:hypothetical protein